MYCLWGLRFDFVRNRCLGIGECGVRFEEMPAWKKFQNVSRFSVKAELFILVCHFIIILPS